MALVIDAHVFLLYKQTTCLAQRVRATHGKGTSRLHSQAQPIIFMQERDHALDLHTEPSVQLVLQAFH